MDPGSLHEFYASHHRIRRIYIYLPSFLTSSDTRLKAKSRLLDQELFESQVRVQYVGSITNLSSKLDSSSWRYGDKALSKASHICVRWSKQY